LNSFYCVIFIASEFLVFEINFKPTLWHVLKGYLKSFSLSNAEVRQIYSGCYFLELWAGYFDLETFTCHVPVLKTSVCHVKGEHLSRKISIGNFDFSSKLFEGVHNPWLIISQNFSDYEIVLYEEFSGEEIIICEFRRDRWNVESLHYVIIAFSVGLVSNCFHSVTMKS